MIESQAKAWLVNAVGVSRETMERLDEFADGLVLENKKQNLISRSTLTSIYTRHIVDSAQLLVLAREERSDEGLWLDLGSGAGFPGLIVAALSNYRVALVESRRLRCDWLAQASLILGVSDRVEIFCSPVDRISGLLVNVISARAFAPLSKLIRLAAPFADENSLWLLPKGRNAKAELEAMPDSVQKMFHVEQSVTDVNSSILIGKGKV